MGDLRQRGHDSVLPNITYDFNKRHFIARSLHTVLSLCLYSPCTWMYCMTCFFPGQCPAPGFLCKHVCLSCVLYNKLTYLLLHPFNGLFSRTTWVSRYQKGKISLDLKEARDDGVLGMAVASVGPYANNLHLAPDTMPRMPFLPPSQQCQSTEGTKKYLNT